MRVVGSCKSGCGQCCKLIAFPDYGHIYDERTSTVYIPVSDTPSPRKKEFLDARGIEIKDGYVRVVHRDAPNPVVRMRYGAKRVPSLLIKHTCPQLNEDDNTCKLHGDQKPEVCRIWPTPDDDLSIVPECGFKVVSDHAVEDNSSN